MKIGDTVEWTDPRNGRTWLHGEIWRVQGAAAMVGFPGDQPPMRCQLRDLVRVRDVKSVVVTRGTNA